MHPPFFQGVLVPLNMTNRLEELKQLDAVGADGKPCRNCNGVLEEKS